MTWKGNRWLMINLRAKSLPRCIHSMQKCSSGDTCQLSYSQISNSGRLFAFIFKHHSGFICYHRNRFKFGCVSLGLFKIIRLILNHCTLDAAYEMWKMASAVTPRPTMAIFSLSLLRDTPNKTKPMTDVLPRDQFRFSRFSSPTPLQSVQNSSPTELVHSWNWKTLLQPGNAFTSTNIL